MAIRGKRFLRWKGWRDMNALAGERSLDTVGLVDRAVFKRRCCTLGGSRCLRCDVIARGRVLLDRLSERALERGRHLIGALLARQRACGRSGEAEARAGGSTSASARVSRRHRG